MSNKITESVVADAALAWFGDLGYQVVHGPEIAPGEPAMTKLSSKAVSGIPETWYARAAKKASEA